MADTIKKLTIEGFKSIRKLEDFELGGLNVLIGANGAGKSNFVSFFRLLRDLIQQRLQTAIAVEGGADSCLFLGPKETRQLTAKLYFGKNGYEFSLVPTHDGRLIFSDELGQTEESFVRNVLAEVGRRRVPEYDQPGVQLRRAISLQTLRR